MYMCMVMVRESLQFECDGFENPARGRRCLKRHADGVAGSHAFARRVPVVCSPLGSDQHEVVPMIGLAVLLNDNGVLLQ